MSDIPASWQPDPRGRHEYRYWDGTAWTDHVSDQGNVSQDPVDDVTPPAETAEAPATTSEPDATEVQPAATQEPEPVAAAEPEPEPAPAEPQPAAAAAEPRFEPVAAQSPSEPVIQEKQPSRSSTPPAATTPSTQQTDARAAAQQIMTSKSPELATVLSVVAPGSGHFYMGAANAVPVGVGLLVATAAAVVLSYLSFVGFIVGLLLWIGAAGFALTDLRGGVQSVQQVSLPANIVGLLLIGAGVLLIVGVFLPFYTFEGLTISAIKFMTIIDLIVLAVGAAAILSGAATLGLGPVTAAELPRGLPAGVAIGGAVVAVLVLFRMFVIPDGGDSSIGRGFGALLLLDSALLIVLANVGILRSLAAGNRPPAA